MEEEVFDLECESEEYDQEYYSEDDDDRFQPLSPLNKANKTMQSPTTAIKMDKKRPSGLPFSSLPSNNHFDVKRNVSGTTYMKLASIAKSSTVERLI